MGDNDWYVEINDKGIWVEAFGPRAAVWLLALEDMSDPIGTKRYATSIKVLTRDYEEYVIKPVCSVLVSHPCASCDALIPAYDIHYLCFECR